MILHKSNLLAFLASAALLSACGTSTTGGGGTGGTGGASIAKEDLTAATMDMFCYMAASCDGDVDFKFSSDAACKAFLAETDEIGGPNELKYIEKGTVVYDGASAAACLAAFKAQCNMEDEPAACEKTFTGKVEVGGACEANAECAGEAECTTDDKGCNGKCAARGGEGDSCEAVGCKAGFACDNQSKKCVVEKLGADGDDCDTNECGEGLFCDYSGGSGVPKCRPLGGEGKPCESHSQCQNGLACSGDKCVKPAAADATCDDPGDSRVCAAGHVCSIIGKLSEKTAKCLPVAKAGEACKSHLQCVALDLYCQGLETGAAEGKCGSLPKIGEACTPPGDAFPQFFACLTGRCDATAKKCVPYGAKGDACDDTKPCGKGLDCDDTTSKCAEEAAPVCK